MKSIKSLENLNDILEIKTSEKKLINLGGILQKAISITKNDQLDYIELITICPGPIKRGKIYYEDRRTFIFHTNSEVKDADHQAYHSEKVGEEYYQDLKKQFN